MTLIEQLVKNHHPAIKARARMEASIVLRLLETLIAAGYSVSVDDGDGDAQSGTVEKLAGIIFSVDASLVEVCRGRKWIGTVSLVLGNDGWDVISDYTTSLEDIIKPANDYADRLAEGGPIEEN
jgi:hypothetical protein